MANHWFTNRGKYQLVANGWDNLGATDLRMGFVEGTSVPATMDTEAEIQDLNTVAELLALAGVAEPTATGYDRITLTMVAAAEDDTNDRVDLDTADAVSAAIDTGDNVIAGFIYEYVDGTDANDLLWSVFTLDTAVPTNGSTITATIADLYRAA